MANFDFLQSARTSQKVDEIKTAIINQVHAGVVTEAELQKVLELIKDARRLRTALKFL